MNRIAQAVTGVSLHRGAARACAGLVATALMGCVVGAVAGCGDRGALNPGRTSTAEVQFNVSAPLYVMTLAITVTGPGIDTPLVFNFPIDNGTATGVMALPAGSQRRIVALAFDSLGVNTHRADTTVTVVGGTTPSVSIILWPIIGDLPVVITTGVYSVTITRGDTTLSQGDSLQYQAVVRDPSAALVPGAATVWASTNPSVVSVDNSGLAYALVPGSARIVASYRGAAASHALTVP
ncbi:MAG: Ig-like domain-containing protein [Gemmatimonadales bacterium]